MLEMSLQFWSNKPTYPTKFEDFTLGTIQCKIEEYMCRFYFSKHPIYVDRLMLTKLLY